MPKAVKKNGSKKNQRGASYQKDAKGNLVRCRECGRALRVPSQRLPLTPEQKAKALARIAQLQQRVAESDKLST